jgi:hypothetical protein
MAADRKTLPQQMAALARLGVTAGVSIRGARLRWTGRLQPTPLSVEYVLGLGFKLGESGPAVEVLDPVLRGEDVDALPHVYAGDRLCLCYPWQWTDNELIARTIIPWASEWLLHYEVWKVTGDWRGGGHEPAVAGEAFSA